MNRASLAILIGAILTFGSASVVDAQSGPQTGGNAASLASGTPLNAELSATLDSKKAKPGDPVIGHTTDAVKADGNTVTPKGAKLVGHVTRSSARSKGDADSVMAIQFDKVILKNGQEIAVSVWIAAIASAPRSAPQTGADQSSPGLNPVAGTGSAAAAGSPMRTTRVPVVGDPSTDSSASGVPTDPAGSVDATGKISASSRGVLGLEGLHLSTEASSDVPGSIITSSGKNVHLDSGIRLLLIVQSEVSTVPNK